MINYESKNLDNIDREVLLNPNHTHFLLCDGLSNDADKGCGKEITFRVNLENQLIKGKSLKDYRTVNFSNEKKQRCPLVLIVIKGGFNTLEFIHSHQRRPILILVGTRGCADLIAQILQLSNEKYENYIHKNKYLTM